MPSTFSLLQDAISAGRLQPYRKPNDDDKDLIARYLWNVCLCESFYGPLQHLEVTLRNAMHTQIAAFKRNPLWLDEKTSWLEVQQADAVAEAKRSIARHGKAPTPGRLLSELPFSFWTGLLRSEYEQNLWPRLIVRVFPHFPPNHRPRPILSRRLNDIRHFRNRVFHHEPIWNRPHLKDEYEDVIETIGWMNDAMMRVTCACETFPSVFNPRQLQDLKTMVEKEF